MKSASVTLANRDFDLPSFASVERDWVSHNFLTKSRHGPHRFGPFSATVQSRDNDAGQRRAAQGRTPCEENPSVDPAVSGFEISPARQEARTRAPRAPDATVASAPLRGARSSSIPIARPPTSTPLHDRGRRQGQCFPPRLRPRDRTRWSRRSPQPPRTRIDPQTCPACRARDCASPSLALCRSSDNTSEAALWFQLGSQLNRSRCGPAPPAQWRRGSADRASGCDGVRTAHPSPRGGDNRHRFARSPATRR